MNKVELIEKVALDARVTKKDASEIVNCVFDTILDSLKSGDLVKIAGFGSFQIKTRASREGMNPITKERISIPEQKAIVFHAAKPAKDRVND